ncbi:MAG: SEC-C domain-containing protein [Candidatus Cybelea sp.]
MNTLGRRQPCHCGSGKRYKNCCYAEDAANAGKVKTNPASARTTIPLSKLGVAGEQAHILIAPIFSDGREAPKEGRSGDYEIVFFFRRPGTTLNESSVSVGIDEHVGSSFLGIANPAVTFHDPRFNRADTKFKLYVSADGKTFEAFGSPNKEGFLSDFRVRLVADSILDAGNRAKTLLVPEISALSFSSDIPLDISHTVVHEVATGVVQRDIIVPFHPTTTLLQPHALPSEARILFNRYRDGISSNDPNWRFLCFASIVEQLWKRTKDGKSDADLEVIVIPKADADFIAWFKSAFPRSYALEDHVCLEDTPIEARGMTTNDVIVKFIRPLRTSIAHSLLEDGTLPSDRDDVKHRVEIGRWSTLLRCITRIHLQIVFPTPTAGGA